MKTKQEREFGDFQTPFDLARQLCTILSRSGLQPASILEPTCGVGSFLQAALEAFPDAREVCGFEINSDYAAAASRLLHETHHGSQLTITCEDFFTVDWESVLQSLPNPLLIIGNPPWVTNAELGSLKSHNLPMKSNFRNHRGIEAITGKSNFNISEWMLLRSLDWIRDRQGMLAVLCKTAVARKVLLHAWSEGLRLERSHLYRIDARGHFNAAVDACFLVITASRSTHDYDCDVYDSLVEDSPANTFGYREGRMVADVPAFERWKHLEGKGSKKKPFEECHCEESSTKQSHACALTTNLRDCFAPLAMTNGGSKWRSGIKHDCSAVMELRFEDGMYRNGLGELVDLEEDYLYPMLKSADIAKGQTHTSRFMLVPQRVVGESTDRIQEIAPKTWEYLKEHGSLLDRRASSIYRNRPRFSIFGVGDYSFTSWKVVISGFYKKLEFRAVGPSAGKPVVLDDTCYFLPCRSEEEAIGLARMLNSDVAREFFSAFIFWDAKRPITIELLQRLDLSALARELDVD